MDFIDIIGLSINSIIGIKPEERIQEQPLFVDIRLGFSFSDTVANDDIGSTIDYEHVSDFVTSYIKSQNTYLIETLALNVIESLFSKYSLIRYIKLRIEKPQAIPSAKTIAVELERHRG